MTLLGLIVLLLVFVAVLWLLSRYVTPAVPAPIGTLVLAVVAILMIAYLLSVVGLLSAINQPIATR